MINPWVVVSLLVVVFSTVPWWFRCCFRIHYHHCLHFPPLVSSCATDCVTSPTSPWKITDFILNLAYCMVLPYGLSMIIDYCIVLHPRIWINYWYQHHTQSNTPDRSQFDLIRTYELSMELLAITTKGNFTLNLFFFLLDARMQLSWPAAALPGLNV